MLDNLSVLDLSLSREKVGYLSTVLDNMSLRIEKVDDDQGLKPGYSREAVSPDVQFVCQVCEKLFRGELSQS